MNALLCDRLEDLIACYWRSRFEANLTWAQVEAALVLRTGCTKAQAREAVDNFVNELG